jgi:photosystem II stability/assembly factor-like uncharacterized protein
MLQLYLANTTMKTPCSKNMTKLKNAIVAILAVLSFSCEKETIDVNEPSSIPGLELSFTLFGEGYIMQDIHFLDNSNGFACGYFGKIIITQDEGKTWSEVQTNITTHLYGIDFINSHVGVAVGGESSCGGNHCEPIGGVIVKTSDGGLTWNQIPVSMTEKVELRAVHFINETVGFAIGGATLLRTDDAGNTWKETVFEELERFDKMHSIDFNNENGAIACVFGKLITTNDSGKTWRIQPTNNTEGTVSVAVTSQNEIYMSGNTKISKSNDFGNTWSELTDSPNDNFDINFISPTIGFAVGRGKGTGGHWGRSTGSIYHTADGGTTWIGNNTIHETGTLSGSSFPTEKQGYINGGGKIIKVIIK